MLIFKTYLLQKWRDAKAGTQKKNEETTRVRISRYTSFSTGSMNPDSRHPRIKDPSREARSRKARSHNISKHHWCTARLTKVSSDKANCVSASDSKRTLRLAHSHRSHARPERRHTNHLSAIAFSTSESRCKRTPYCRVLAERSG